MQQQIVVLGNPENRRVTMFQEAAKKLGVACEIYAYQDLLQHKITVEEIVHSEGVLRIESPGENAIVREALIQKGNTANKVLQNFPLEHGQIAHNKLWYKGFSALLQELNDANLNLKTLNSPKAIQLMFHKLKCQQLLQKNNIEIPLLLGKIDNYEHLQEILKQYQYHQVFIKPFHNSSASGVLAFRQVKHQLSLTTSVELIYEKQNIKLYNSLKVRKYRDAQSIKDIINTLCKDGMYAERWIPKANTQEGIFDLRILVINGQARHTVIRQSQHPITNLHLGNQRGDLNKIKTILGAEKWQNIQELAVQAVQTLPPTTYAGVDLLVSNSWKKFYILEINAFGDLLPNLLHQNETTYEAVLSGAVVLGS